jgi:hypothetical protein
MSVPPPPEPPLAPQVRLPSTLAIHPYLASHLNSLAPKTCAIQIEQLLQISVYERKRENTMYCNKELLVAIHIPPSFTSAELQEAQKKQKAKEDVKEKKCSNMNNNFEPDSSNSNLDVDSADAPSRVLPL